VLTDGAVMPKAAALPESLQAFARRHAVELKHEHFRVNATSLTATLESFARAKADDNARAEQDQREKDAAEHAERKRRRRADSEERAKQAAAERDRLGRERAERLARERAAAEAAEREQTEREEAHRQGLAARFAALDGKDWQDLSRPTRQRYLALVDMVRDTDLSPVELAEQDGLVWIRLDASERWKYQTFVREAREPPPPK
jgi:hypothetical protein